MRRSLIWSGFFLLLATCPSWARSRTPIDIAVDAAKADRLMPLGFNLRWNGDPDTIPFGFYETINGQPFAVPGEQWTFDHGGPDPLEGWTALDLSSDPAPYFRVITEQSWQGHGNEVYAPYLNPGATAWLGLFQDEAEALCYLDGLGYGNLWAQQYTSPLFSLTGSGDLALTFQYFSDLEVDFDQVRLKLLFPNGSSLPIGSPIEGAHGMPSENNGETMTIVVPADSLAGQSQCQVRFEMTSDSGWSDEDGSYLTTHGPFGFSNFAAYRGGVRVAQYFDHQFDLAPVRAVDGTQSSEQFGNSVCVFEVTGDGYDDLIVGSPFYSNGQAAEGRVVIYAGAPTGGFFTPAIWTCESNSANAHFGWSVAAGYGDAGNTNPMVVIGAPGYSNGQSAEGRVYVYGGNFDTTPEWTYESNSAGAQLGYSLDCDDLNGNGRDDIVAGAPFCSSGQSYEGRIYGFTGLGNASFASLWSVESNQDFCFLGTLVHIMDDYGGYVLTGTPYYDGANGVDCGAVESRDGPTGIAAGRVEGAQAGSNLGLAIAEIWDFDLDGATDIAVSENLHTTAPAVNILYCQGVGELTSAGVFEDATFGTSITGAYQPWSPFNGSIVMATSSSVRVLDLQTWPTVAWSERWSAAISGGNGGVALDASGDLNNDGQADLVVGLPGYSSGRGRVQVHLLGEIDDSGWVAAPIPALGTQAGVAAASAYALPSGACGLSGNVLEMHDATGHHPTGQHIRLLSPIIDLTQLGSEYDHFVAKADAFLNSPLSSGLYVRGGWMYYPWSDCNGVLQWSPPDLGNPSFEYGYDGCWSARWDSQESPVGADLGSAQQVRFYLEFWASCTPIGGPPDPCVRPDDFSPLFDNIVIGAIDSGDVSGTVRRTPVAGDCSQATTLVPNVRVLLNRQGGGEQTRMAWTDASGHFSFHDLTLGGLYNVSLDPPDHWWSGCVTPYGGTFTYNGAPIRNVVVGMTPEGSEIDLAVELAGGQAKPGFVTTYGLTCRNPGTAVASAPLVLQLPAEVSFVSCSGTGAYHAGTHTVEWSAVGLPPLGSHVEQVRGTVAANTPLGSSLHSSVDYGPPSGETVPSDNEDTCVQEVVGALDPNDKQVAPTGVIPAGELLTYQINFQNVGTAAATNVRIEDTLEPDLDLATLALGSTSHPPSSVYVSGRTVVWEFNGIELPDSASNEAGSHGFVGFRARPAAGLPGGQEITNQARIFFDFAPPVPTNVVTNTLQNSAATEPAVDPGGFSVRLAGALPVRGQVDLELAIPASGHLGVTVHDVSGRAVRHLAADPAAAGIYRLRWDRTDDGGNRVPAGVYFARAEWNGPGHPLARTARMVVLE